MCAKTSNEIGKAARRAALDVCWSQWQALGALAVPVGDSGAKSIIDPEALVLASLGMRKYERRLNDFLAWWSATGSMFMSVQRLSTLSAQFPVSVQEGIGGFALLAANAGDRRWKKHSSGQPIPHRGFKGSREPHLQSVAAEMLRLRAGFGVGVKADVLTFLLGIRGTPATVKEVARATAYSERSVRTAAVEMALAGMIHKRPGRPARYRVEPEPWLRLLSSTGSGNQPASARMADDSPHWCYWAQLLAFLLAVVEWQSLPRSDRITEYVLSSQARDLYYHHEMAFALNNISVPNPEHYVGEEYLKEFSLTLTLVSEWLSTHT